MAITNEQGHVVERFYYDAFGKQLTAVTPTGDNLYKNTLDLHLTDRGFTGHRSIQSGLVHMGGRVYDPKIGRFLSADPHIQFAGNLQNYNRYSYVNNNPLSFNDPSGYFISKIFKAIKKLFKFIAKIVKKVIKVVKKVVKFIKENLRTVIAVVVVVAVYAPYLLKAIIPALTATSATGAVVLSGSIASYAAAGALAGGVSGLISTGSLKGAFKGAVFGAITGGFARGVTAGKAFAGAVKVVGEKAVLTLGHGIIGGARAVVNGGKFATGFLTGAVGKLTTFATNTIQNPVVQGLAVATAGGAVSALAGGSFEMGFITAGLGFAANQVLTKAKQDYELKRKNIRKNLSHPPSVYKIGATRRWFERYGTEMGLNGLQVDALRHCATTCRLAFNMTPGDAKLIANGRELLSPRNYTGQVNDGFFNEDGDMDVANNNMGAEVAYQNGAITTIGPMENPYLCVTLCEDKLLSDALDVDPEQ